MGASIAYVAKCQGSASLDEQKSLLNPDDHVVVAGRHSFAQFENLLHEHRLTLSPGDHVKIFDLSCIDISTTTLIRIISRLLAKGISFEIVKLNLVIKPPPDDQAGTLLTALNEHYRLVHGRKTHPQTTAPRGRKRLIDVSKIEEIRARLGTPGVTATAVAEELGVARSTLFNFLKRHDASVALAIGKDDG